ncbi:hypothetical protein AMJ39_04990 [candidate division TA06 bacterium DG_24]|uniref:Putative auto-transporter adhesin head GIN domain-containing protein n=3 Tax=Bacteria division TA06 TaxID=1156500 RepID=A0A0S8JNZ0_UNCT6|nr:MAG: hypothetical protein AMJ39_04990 [candidate division TA06 bacterium DG_24]KPK69429.1 MAG: hypothetical protein AMJ82_05605 [candidate division TA06 bacterium SM23_40]KPL11386.1 MAG: hypothetical protein AMJ71_01075 [candidate division TA06 bacterium SM1_40]
MTHRLLLTCTLTLMLMTGAVAAEGSGNIITESREVADFNCISLSGTGRVIIDQGEEESLTIVAEDNIMPYVEVEVRDRTLHLGFHPDKSPTDTRSTKPVTFKVGMREILGLAVSGPGRIHAPAITTEALDAAVSGPGKIAISSCTANRLAVDISGSGCVAVAGETPIETVNISGSGRYVAPELESETTTVVVTGTGCATVCTHDNLTATVTGTGEVAYYGSPIVAQVMEGSGRLTQLGR